MMKKVIHIGTSLVLTCMASQVFAAGFQIQEQNALNLGLAYSGTAALAEDASMAFYNAAGLSKIKNNQVVVSAVGIAGSFDFEPTSSTVDGVQLSSVFSDDAGSSVAVPGLYLAARINPKWMFGMSVAVPFGLKTEYSDDGVMRYVATVSEIKTIQFSPSVAYQVLPCLSVAAGPDLMWAKARLEARLPGVVAPKDVVALDGFQKNSGEDWSYGYHVGLMWEPVSGTRIGLHYRSKFNLHLEGDSELLLPGDVPGLANSYTIRDVRTENVALPESATFSFYHEINDTFAVTGDAAWTNWSRLDHLRLRFDPPGTASPLDTDTDLNFRDANRYALGLIYTHSDCWKFRTGVSYDETPVRDGFRTARIPDENRIWLSVGLGYTFNKNLRVDAGYAHLFFSDADLDDQGPYSALTTTPVGTSSANARRVQGSYDANANILGVQLRYDFV